MIVSRRPRFFPRATPSETRFVTDLLRSERVGGTIALVAAVVAVLWANLAGSSYDDVQHLALGPLDLQEWAADGGLAVFFFLAGLELKRELLVGSLRRPADAAVPVVAAACGVAVPAAVYLVVNTTASSGAPGGWAIPAATDIAFAVAVLSIVGSALPSQLRAFLLTLAVVDDLIVIVIIAVAYTSTLDLGALAIALALFVVYGLLQRGRVRSSLLYLPLAAMAWSALHASGVHATIAGVALGLLTRVRPDPDEMRSPAERLEHRIAPLSAGVAVPLFALMSAGVELGGWSHLVRSPIAVGVALGLVLGKPVGILAGSWLVTRFTRAELDDAVGWRDLAGVAILGGIGFTVSLLVAELSFTGAMADEARTAVLAGSLVSALLGIAVLRRRARHHRGY